MKRKAVFPGKYIQGQGALHELPALINLFGRKALLLGSPTALESVWPCFGPELSKDQAIIETFRGECSETELKRLSGVIDREGIHVVIGMGGGKTIDTAKIAADRANIPVLVVPTIASTDAPCSGCAVTYTDDGIFEQVLYQKLNPAVVLVDMDVIASAPVRFLVAGMGDALATLFEARSCVTTFSANECGGLSTLAGLHLARLCYDTLLEYGITAKMANEAQIVTPVLEYITEANILLSGIGFESSGLAAAHSIHNGLTALPETHAYFHGEKVAFGVLSGLFLTAASPKEIDEVYGFCESIGLPTTLEELGLHVPGREKLIQVATKACAPNEGIHHEAQPVTPEKVLNAMRMADLYGQERKKLHAK